MKKDKLGLFLLVVIGFLLLILVVSTRAQTGGNQLQSAGGSFTLTKSVVAGGGRETQNMPVLSAHVTAGQTVSGVASQGGQFALYSGFWTPENFAPTAATVPAGGRIISANGRGIRNVLVTVTFSSGETRTTLSGTSGYYRFGEIPAGETYIFSVSGKRYVFSQPTQVRNILEETNDIDFIASEQSSQPSS